MNIQNNKLPEPPLKNNEPDLSNIITKKVSLTKKNVNKGKQSRKAANKEVEITCCGLLPLCERLYNYLNCYKKKKIKIKIGRVYLE